MRILRIFYDWPGNWNGLAPAGYEITREQLNAGHKVTVMCGFWNSNPPKELPNLNIISILREPFEGAIYFTSSVLLFFKYFFWRNKYKVDIIHSHGHFAIWIYYYRLLVKKLPYLNFEHSPLFVTHFHNTFAGRWDSLKTEGKKIKWFSEKIAWPMGIKSDKWAIEASDLCIFVSQNLLEEAVKFYGADRNKCFVLENGVNTQIFKSVNSIERDKTRKELGYDVFDKIIINHGNMVARKNITALVESLRFLPINYKILLIGSGPKEYMDQIDKVIIDNLLGSRIKKVSYTPYPELPILLQASDIFVLPSDFEGLPKVVLESLATEVPCLVSGFKFTEPVSGVTFLENKTPEEIAKNIKIIGTNPPKIDIDNFRIKFSWKTKIGVLDNLYKRLLSDKKPI
jgi:glycosyltransferase involved in cell wall biosynthesis